MLVRADFLQFNTRVRRTTHRRTASHNGASELTADTVHAHYNAALETAVDIARVCHIVCTCKTACIHTKASIIAQDWNHAIVMPYRLPRQLRCYLPDPPHIYIHPVTGPQNLSPQQRVRTVAHAAVVFVSVSSSVCTEQSHPPFGTVILHQRSVLTSALLHEHALLT